MSEDRLEARWRKAAWRAKRRELGLPIKPGKEKRAPRRATVTREFLGVVAIGAGSNSAGQQNLHLLRAGEHELTSTAPLRTLQCLLWITTLPPASEATLVTYALAYLATHVLRDLPPERLSNAKGKGLFDERQGQTRYTYWNDYGIDYLPGNYLRVCRIARTKQVDPITKRPWIKYAPIPDSARTITDVRGCFRKPLVKALADFGIGGIERERLATDRLSRLALVRVNQTVRDSCALECRLLADLMTSFRALCHDAGLRPRAWSGAGKLADYLHRENRTLRAEQLVGLVAPGAKEFARRAYYAGRMETTRVGDVGGPIFEYDINGGFPAAMLELPCLLHGRWHRLEADDFAVIPPDATFIADVSFRHPDRQFLCGLPIRRRGPDGQTLLTQFPSQGEGTYWSHELRSAERLGAVVEYHSGWQLTRHCRCQQFPWVAALYEQRLAYGKDLQGETIKTAMASLYGKLVQRRGAARYLNLIWAGMITATVRAWIHDAVRESPDDIVMIATDGIFSRVPLSLPVGEGLGQWSAKRHDRAFIVQSGLWWGAARPRTRGVAVNLFEPHTAKFETAWRAYAAGANAAPPVVRVPLRLFTSLRLAHARGDLGQARQIIADDGGKGRAYAFHWAHKRGAFEWEGQAVKTWPLGGGAGSLSHLDDLELINSLDLNRLELEALPDVIDLSIPYSD